MRKKLDLVETKQVIELEKLMNLKLKFRKKSKITRSY